MDTLQVFRPDRLCAPASKAVESPDGSLPEPPPLGDIEQRLDLFRCYRVGGTLPPPQVILEDQFATERAFLSSAGRLCNTVEKQRFGFPVTPIVRPFAHLVCYRFFVEAPGSAPDAATRIQFGTVQFFSILTGGFGELCVPSLTAEPASPAKRPASQGLSRHGWAG